MPRTRLALIASIGAVVLLVACSSGNDSTPATTVSTGTSRTGAPTASTASATSTTPPAPTGPLTGAAKAVRIVRLSGPRSPVSCNAPTSVELHFEARNATSVTLRINGGEVFATYSNGPHDELVPLACDGSPQKYLFTALGASGTTATKTLTLETSMLAAS